MISECREAGLGLGPTKLTLTRTWQRPRSHRRSNCVELVFFFQRLSVAYVFVCSLVLQMARFVGGRRGEDGGHHRRRLGRGGALRGLPLIP